VKTSRSLNIPVIVACLLSLPSWSADKQPALPKDLPPYGPLKPLQAKELKESKLDNGLQVWLIPEKGFPKVAAALAVRGGYTADPKDRPGMADLIAAAVTQGTAKRSARQLAEQAQLAGGDLNAGATADLMVIDTSVLAANTQKAVELLADIATNAAFADAEVEITKRNLSSALEAQEGEPSFLAGRALYRALFGDHPYAITAPTQDSLAKTTAADLRREYRRRFRPDQAVLILVGEFDEQTTSAAIMSAFNAWHAPTEPVLTPVAAPVASRSQTVTYVPRAGSVQTTLAFGALTPSHAAPDYYSAAVANAIYGGMFGSRLITNIREDKGYTYSPGARITPLRAAGVLVTDADVRNEVTAASFNEIAYEMNRMASTAPTEKEVESAKRYLIGSMAIRSQSRASVVRTLARLWSESLPPAELWLAGTKIEHVSPADVEAAGRKYFPMSRMTMVAVGDEKVIKDSLAPFGLEFRKAQ